MEEETTEPRGHSDMYREVRDCLQTMQILQKHLEAAIIADDTRVMAPESAAAMAEVDQILAALRSGTKRADEGQGCDDEGDADRVMVEAAIAALGDAWTTAEKVGLAGSAPEMRARLLTFKTNADYADAYLRAAVKLETV